ncbi:PRC-barrel domain-containing protein [Pseudosporangium ferrugineum]|uniref:Sporulation protein YlmC with PRC-barrel domain n=1 Tax=Pseudosporangium ferrugineum TaxID=439699 RepID=A0A2T0RGA9_9ACTN|nr:PRC-barrel domain-containing protein [Pseudosporangium ferrugineum]PRY20140.1 sporulation protein YlmC with PRC-barrel domain [Pseudosporangium ferrugineum]
MAPQSSTSLVKLSDSGRVLADPAEDIRGRTVADPGGDELGKVEDLLIDEEEGKVRFLRVEHGGILGFGATPSFVPVDAITGITDDTVTVSESRERVAGAPRYDPDLVQGSEYFDQLYGYYGYTPYWGTGYLYPGFPYLRG